MCCIQPQSAEDEGGTPRLNRFVGVVLVGRGGELLVPHRIGRHQVELPQPAVSFGERGPVHRVAQGDLGLHVVQKGVHPGDGERGRVDLLAEKLERGHARRKAQPPVCLLSLRFQEPEVALDQQSRRTAAGVIDGHARLGVEDDRHEHGHLTGCVELARALALALGELT